MCLLHVEPQSCSVVFMSDGEILSFVLLYKTFLVTVFLPKVIKVSIFYQGAVHTHNTLFQRTYRVLVSESNPFHLCSIKVSVFCRDLLICLDKSLYFLLYFFFLFKIEPVDVFVSLKPCSLSFCIFF